MTYFLLTFCLLLAVLGVIIVNKISSKSQEVRDNLKLKTQNTSRYEVVEYEDDTSFNQSMDINYLYSLYLEMEDLRKKEMDDNEIKFKNIRKALNNIEKKQSNVYISDLLKDSEVNTPSNKEIFEYSHLN